MVAMVVIKERQLEGKKERNIMEEKMKKNNIRTI